MKQLILRIFKIFTLFGIIVFMIMQIPNEQDSSTSIEKVESSTIQNIDVSNMSKQDNLSIKRFLDLDPSQYMNIVYYKSNDAMQASEFVIVRFKDDSQQNQFKEKIDARVQNQKKIFEGYAPEQAELLANNILDIHANYALYVVSPNAKQMDEQFIHSL